MVQRMQPAGPPGVSGRSLLLPVVLAALLLPGIVGAQEQRPLFVPVQVLPEQLAALSEGVSSTPGAGPWCLLSTLWAGTHPDVDAWSLRGAMSSRAGRNQVGAATLFLGGFQANPASGTTTSLATLLAGHETGANCWTLLDTDQVQPFPESLRDGRIHDRQPLSKPSPADIQEARLSHRWKDGRVLGPIRDGKGIYVGDEEARAFAEVLVLANYTSARAFQRAARRDLSYANLFNEPEKHRGEVVHLSGRLLRLTRFSPPLEAAGMGVNDYYEAWIANDIYGSNPYCALCVELPPGLQPAEKIRGVEVAFDGYFYKRFRYKAADSVRPNEYRDAPILIGHALTVLKRPAAEEEGQAETWGYDLLKAFIGIVVAVLAGIAALTGWFRYADRRVQRRLRAAREAGIVLPEPEGDNAEPGT